jgi:DNA-directed RNA polymerase specialized sigma24 family protein
MMTNSSTPPGFPSNHDRRWPRDHPAVHPNGAQGTPEDETLSQDLERTLFQALERLPEPHRQVILWRHRDKIDFGQIGERLHRTAEAARGFWLRSLELLTQELHQRP